MADSRDARPPTDEETAPLLQDVSHPDEASEQQERGQPSFSERISSVAQEPLTPLSKFLCILALFLLLLSSIFIGLFAGAQHKLNTRPPEGGTPETVTRTVTATDIETSIRTSISVSVSRTTDISTSISTGISTRTTTSTEIHTKTVEVPVPGPTGTPACFTPDCILLASSVIASLDTSKDPCNGFFDFANGGWLKNHPIPSDKGSVGSFELLSEQNRRLIQQILSPDSSSLYDDVLSSVSLETSDPAESDDPYDQELLKKLRGMYTSCMNEDLINARGGDPLLRVVKIVQKLFNGKPAVISSEDQMVINDSVENDKKKERDGLTAAVAYLHSRGISALFSTEIEGDVGEDPNKMTLLFGQPSLGLPSKEYYDEESITDLYQSVLERLLIALDPADLTEEIVDVSVDAGLPVHEERLRVWPPWPWPPWDGDGGDDDDGGDKPRNRTEEAPRLAQDILKFEKKIANASLDLDILYQDPIATYNPVPISNLTDALSQINFPAYFSTFAPRNYPNRVILDQVAFPAALSKILNETSRETLGAYLETRASLALAQYLGTDTDAWKAARTLVEKLRGIKPGAVGDRAEFCVGKIEESMGFAAGRYFVKEAFPGASREKGTKVITDIVATFKKSLKDLKWMDKKSAQAAAEKADAIRVKVGFPLSPDTRVPRSLANYYRLVKVHPDTFFENIMSSRVNDEIKKWFTLGKQRDPEAWEMYPSQVNAYFNPPANEIVFPAGILRPPFFSQSWPGYMSYGAFGQVASHELTHAFDSAGRLYNQQGKLEEWWTNTTSAGFNKIQDCIVQQYSSYTIDDGQGGRIHVNGNLTSGENIGDSGLIQAYRAWQAQFAESNKAGNEYLLPGLNYTRDQLFFIAFGQIWAQNIKPASLVARVRSDPHSPNRFRVDGTLSNIPEFAKVFKCPVGSKLNPPPEKRCIFW